MIEFHDPETSNHVRARKGSRSSEPAKPPISSMISHRLIREIEDALCGVEEDPAETFSTLERVRIALRMRFEGMSDTQPLRVARSS